MDVTVAISTTFMDAVSGTSIVSGPTTRVMAWVGFFTTKWALYFSYFLRAGIH